MRLAIDLTRLNRSISGMERFAMMITYNMIKCSDDEYFLLFKDEVHPLFKEFENDSRVKFLLAHGDSNLLFDLFVLPYRMSKIKADKYLFLAFPIPIFFFKRNAICTIHDLGCWDCPETMIWKFKIYFRIALRLSALKCKDIITVSNFTKERIIDKLKYDRKHIHVIYNGVSESFFNNDFTSERLKQIKKKYQLPDSYLLCLSVIQPRKNMELLLKACSELWKENKLDIPLVLAGKNGWKSSQLIDTKNTRLHFTGYIDEEDLPGLYHMAKAFIFPSIYEGFGIPPVEAMAASTLVLSSDGPCMPEILEDAAIYFRNNDLDDLKEKIIELDKVDTKTMIEKGKIKAQDYVWKLQAENLLKLLKEGQNV